MNMTKLKTCNKGSREGWLPDIIVYHITDCTLDETIRIFEDPLMERSSNYIVGRNGKIVQMVDIREKAWCQGLHPDAIKAAKLPVVAERNINPNFYCISIEHEGIYDETHGKLTEAQLAATIELTHHILSEVRRIYGIDIPADRQHLVGHCDIDPIHKYFCPGELFPFDEILAAQ